MFLREEADIQQMDPSRREWKEEDENTTTDELVRSSIRKTQRKPIMEKCCCWNSVRKGSFASGIFTLVSLLISCMYKKLFYLKDYFPVQLVSHRHIDSNFIHQIF